MTRFFKGVLLFFLVIAVIPGYAQFGIQDMNVHGFISQGFLKTSGNNYLGTTKDGSFEFTEAAINFSVQLTDNLRGGFQLYSRDMGTEGNNQFVLDWGYLDYRKSDWLGIRVGKVKTPMGLYNQGRDVDALRTTILLPQSVYTETWRDFIISSQGASVYGSVPAPHFGYFDYEFTAGTINIGNNSIFLKDKMYWVETGTRMGMIQQLSAMQQLPPGADVSSVATDPTIRAKYIYGGSLKWNTPLSGLLCGATFILSETNLNALVTSQVRMNGMVLNTIISDYVSTVEIKDFYTYSAQYVYNNLNLTAEYLTRTYIISSTQAVNKFVEEGFYGMATYRFTPWLEMGAYYSEFYPDKKDKEGDRFIQTGQPGFLGWQKESVVSLRFDLTDCWMLKLEGHLINGAGTPTFFENPDGFEKDWKMFAIKSSLTF